MTWQAEAACRGFDWWFEKSTGGDRAEMAMYWETRRQVCRGCPVIAECARAGADEPEGMWGGKTPRERGVKPWWIPGRRLEECSG